MSGQTETMEGATVREAAPETADETTFETSFDTEASFDFEALFRSEYARLARTIARVVRDRARAEEIAVDVFLKLWRRPKDGGGYARAWLYRVAIRAALDDLRSEMRRARYEQLLGWMRPRRPSATPEEIHVATEEQHRVRCALARIAPRDAQILLLRSQDFTYDEVAAILDVKPSSVGTLVGRAEERFRKEYTRRYGHP